MPLPIALALPSPLTNNTPLTHIIDSIIQEVFLKKKCALQLNQNQYKGRDMLGKNKLVWLYVTPTARLQIAWTGPYIIIAEKGTTCYVISPIFNNTQTQPLLVHESRLKICRADLRHIKNHIGSHLLSEDTVAELPSPIDLVFYSTPDE